MIGERVRVRRTLAAFIILMGAVGLIAMVALAVLLSAIGDDLDTMWTSANGSLRESAGTLRQGSGAVDGAENALLDVEQSVEATNRGLASVVEALAAARETNSTISEGLMSTGGFLLLAADSFPPWAVLGDTRNALNNAGLQATEAAMEFDALQDTWLEMETRAREIRGSLARTQTELPAVRRDLDGVSVGLANTASSLASIEDTSEGLRQSGLLFWVAVVILAYLGALALAMIVAGVLLL